MQIHKICAELLRAHDELMDSISGVGPEELASATGHMGLLADYFKNLDSQAVAEFTSLSGLIQELDRDAAECRRLAAKWSKKAQTRERAAEWYREQVIRALSAIGGEITTETGERLVVRDNSPSVVIDDLLDVGTLPPICQRLKVEANKIELKKQLEAGNQIPGVHLIRKQSLRIV